MGENFILINNSTRNKVLIRSTGNSLLNGNGTNLAQCSQIKIDSNNIENLMLVRDCENCEECEDFDEGIKITNLSILTLQIFDVNIPDGDDLLYSFTQKNYANCVKNKYRPIKKIIIYFSSNIPTEPNTDFTFFVKTAPGATYVQLNGAPQLITFTETDQPIPTLATLNTNGTITINKDVPGIGFLFQLYLSTPIGGNIFSISVQNIAKNGSLIQSTNFELGLDEIVKLFQKEDRWLKVVPKDSIIQLVFAEGELPLVMKLIDPNRGSFAVLRLNQI